MDGIKNRLLEKIERREARVAVVGLGYVGLPLLVDFAKAGFPVSGIEIDAVRVQALRAGESYVQDISSDQLKELPADRVAYSTGYDSVAGCDAVIICVPTPLNKTRDPDVHFLIEAAQAISEYLRPGTLVCLESTTYPGTTDELLRPLLERDGLRAGEDFFLAFSPERIDPGRKDIRLEDIPKVIGGLTPGCLEAGLALYASIFRKMVPVSSTQSAEMVKLLENTFRAVNIALVNEVAIMCDKLGLDVWEVIEAAATKPYGFMRFTPGPGVGGHCIPLDPHYLAWKLRTLNYHSRFIHLAGEINSQMPVHWVNRVQDALNEAGKAVKDSLVLVLGVSYKKDVSDVRESPALDIIALLSRKGARVSYHDPFVPELLDERFESRCVPDLEEAIRTADCVLVVTDHSHYDLAALRSKCGIFLNTRNSGRLTDRG